MLSLIKKLDDISFKPIDYQKIKSKLVFIKNKTKEVVTRGSVIRATAGVLLDFATTYAFTNLYGIEKEGNLNARNYMKQYGIVEGLLRHNIENLIPVCLESLLMYAGLKLIGKSLKETDFGKTLYKDAYLVSDAIFDIYSVIKWGAGSWNLTNIVSKSVPKPYEDIAFGITTVVSFIPMFYSLGVSYIRKWPEIYQTLKSIRHH